jgi:hypothetical protein
MSRVKPRRASTSGHHPLARVAHLHHLHLPAALLRQLGRGGPLESPWVVAGLGGLLATSVLLAVRRHRQAGPPGGRRRLRRAVLAAWLSGMTALTGLAALNLYVGYVPTLPDLLGGVPTSGGGGGSRVVELSIGAPGLDVPSSPAYVYLPPGYDDPRNAARRYPVVYLLHGYPGGPSCAKDPASHGSGDRAVWSGTPRS